MSRYQIHHLNHRHYNLHLKKINNSTFHQNKNARNFKNLNKNTKEVRKNP